MRPREIAKVTKAGSSQQRGGSAPTCEIDTAKQKFHLGEWRRGWDSNPRYSFTLYNGLANRRLQPLGHLSSVPVYAQDSGALQGQYPALPWKSGKSRPLTPR